VLAGGFFWITHKDNKNASLKEISSDEINHCDLMLLKDDHCLKKHTLDICKLPPPTHHHGFSATSLNTLVQMVLGKMGSTLIPAMALDQLTSLYKDISTVHLNEPSPHRTIAFVIRLNYTRMASVEKLCDLCKTALNKR
jgi:LysR family hydrogen peroxide-inducible transcriptional activator